MQCAAQFIHFIEHTLVLQAVVFVDIPRAMSLERRAYFFIVGHFLEALHELWTLWKLVKIMSGQCVFCRDPTLCFGAVVVFKRAVWVGNLCAEIGVNGVVLRRFRIVKALCYHAGCSHSQC